MAALNEGENTVEVLNYKDSFHPCHVLETLKKLYLKKELCDVVLIVDEQEIKAHRVVLAANSVYFYSMFTTDMCESVQERIPLKGIDYEAVELLVDFCYTSSIKITEKNVQSLLSVSNLLQFNTVIESCCGFLKNQLHPSNCLGIGDFADHHGFTELKAAALCFAEKHFLEVIKCDEFLSAPFEQVSSILKSDFLDVASEKEVFDAIVQWISHDEFPRKKHLAEFLKDVRLPLLPPKILVDCIESDKLVENNDTCMRLISEAKNYHLLPERRDIVPFVTHARCKAHSTMIYIVGGEIHNRVFNSVRRFNFETKEWDEVAGMNKHRDGVGVAVYSGLIYAAGGCDGDVALSSVECYQPTTDKWTYVQPMACGRHAFGLVELDGWLYASGGSDFSRSEYNSLERYDPVRDMWTHMKPMSTMREGLAMVTLDGVIYAIGGDNGVSILGSVERYDPRLDCWSACVAMSYRRRYFGAAVLKNKIFAVGGSDYDEDHNSVECYDPRMNRWMSLPPMLTRRESPAVAAIDDKLYAIGGACMNVETDQIDCYDPLANKWEEFTPLPLAIEGMGVAVL
ncbi:kelch-like protein diablo [Acropora muricata]|uniref:kelch-like protein diablo n=1 Tax=Acropora muricata TaxID=159855 RepID=UPI0034E5790F